MSAKVYINLHPGSVPLVPSVSTANDYDAYWFTIRCDGQEVCFFGQTLDGLRGFARNLEGQIAAQERRCQAQAVATIPMRQLDPIAAQIEAEGPRRMTEAEMLADREAYNAACGCDDPLPERKDPMAEMPF